MKTPFVWLGSKRAAKRGVGNKGALLDQAARAGLPVPNGGIVLHEFYELLREAGIVQVHDEQVVIEHPIELTEALYTAARFPRLNRETAVRSAFSAEDRADESMAGFFTSVLHVDANDPQTLADAMSTVWQSALRRAGDFRRDVLILEMVDAQVAGVAFSEQAYQDDLVNFTQGTADRLVGGAEAGETLTLPQLRWLESVSDELPPFAQRLQRLLRGVRRTFGRGDWDIEWADDGEVCWLLQVRPVTRPTRRNEAYTFANLREILPDPPSPFMTGIVQAASAGFFDYYRHFDATLPDSRQMVDVFAGRPLFNVSLLTDMMRKWGLPTALVTNSLGGDGDVDDGLRLGRFFRHTVVLLRLGWAQLTAVAHARRATDEIWAQAQQPGDSFAALSDTFRDLFTNFVTEMFNLTQALSGPLLILRRTNTLAEHNARQRSIATEIYTDLAPLRELVAGKPRLHDALSAGRVPDDPEFRALWHDYLRKHGHRGIYESDIARPRYHEAPQPLLASLLQPAHERAALPPRTLLGRLTGPLWWQCGRVMRAREQWRYDALRCYDVIRQRFLALAETAVAQGQLPAVSDLWLLRPDEVRALDAGAVYDADFMQQRRGEVDELAAYDLPDLLRRFDDLEQYRQGGAAVAGNGRLSGVSLTDGVVNGRAWVLRQPTTALPAGFEPQETILVARSVDPGWIPTFSLVAGVVVEIGGDLSHGSIILREMGLPAITNVRGATSQLATGDALTLEAGRGRVRLSDEKVMN